MKPKVNFLDRLALQLAPRWALNRLRTRVAVQTIQRHFEAAQTGRRNDGWKRVSTDANSANGPALGTLRNHARDLVRNNGWAKRGKQVIANNTVGWGIVPTPIRAGVRAANRSRDLWRDWAGTTQCDVGGQLNFYGIQRLAVDTIAESGEVLVRRYRRRVSDGLAIPLQLQVLEPDHLDLTRDNQRGPSGGKIVQGVEFDPSGRRVAYWLYPEHPGAASSLFSSKLYGQSVRVPAEDVLHVYHIDRPGQVRGVSWFAAAIVKLKDFDEFEDAQLLRQKIAACFAGYITNVDGAALPLGEQSEDDDLVETIEPGTMVTLTAGKSVTMADPPQVAEGKFDERTLRAIAAALGVTYEDLTGDYSRVNFSSARMSRIAHWANVHDWQWNMLMPRLNAPAWRWAMEAALIAGAIGELPSADWTPQPMPMIDPDKEAKAALLMVRTGQRTPDDIVREAGFDPDIHWPAYAAALDRLDSLGIVLDIDARKRTQQGNDVNARAKVKPASK